jgi:endonuclease I
MVAYTDGRWVEYDEHIAEVRKMQRGMIAGLYFRAGEVHEELLWFFENRRTELLAWNRLHTSAELRRVAQAREDAL